jgi:hypothetical protein
MLQSMSLFFLRMCVPPDFAQPTRDRPRLGIDIDNEQKLMVTCGDSSHNINGG